MSDPTPVTDIVNTVEANAEAALNDLAAKLNAKIGGDAAALAELQATFDHAARYGAAVVGPLVTKGVNFLLGKLLGATAAK